MRAVIVCFGLAVLVASVSAQLQEMMLYNMLMQGSNQGGGASSGMTGTGSSALSLLGSGGTTGTTGAGGNRAALTQAAALAAMSGGRGRARNGMFGGRMGGLGSMLMMRGLGMDQYMEMMMCMQMRLPSFLCYNRAM